MNLAELFNAKQGGIDIAQIVNDNMMLVIARADIIKALSDNFTVSLGDMNETRREFLLVRIAELNDAMSALNDVGFGDFANTMFELFMPEASDYATMSINAMNKKTNTDASISAVIKTLRDMETARTESRRKVVERLHENCNQEHDKAA